MTVNILVGVKNGLANCPTTCHPRPLHIHPQTPRWSMGLFCLVESCWIFCHSTDVLVFFRPKRINPYLDFFLPPASSRMARASFSRYKRLKPRFLCCFVHPECSPLCVSSTQQHVPVCTCCIQFQRILDIITQPIKDHLFRRANLIWPRRRLDGVSSSVTFQGAPLPRLHEHPLTHNVTISRPAPNPADMAIDAPLIAL